MRTSMLAKCASTAAMVALALCCGTDDASTKATTLTAGHSLCASITDYLSECGEPSDCEKALVEDCQTMVGTLNEDYLVKARTCINDGVSPMTCLASSFSGLNPSEAHRGFSTSFCENCVMGVPGCESAFFASE